MFNFFRNLFTEAVKYNAQIQMLINGVTEESATDEYPWETPTKQTTTMTHDEYHHNEELKEVHKYLSSLAEWPTAISVEKRRELIAIIQREVPKPIPDEKID